jgi:hypothetical protein
VTVSLATNPVVAGNTFEPFGSGDNVNYTQDQIDAFCREAADRATAIERERCAKLIEANIIEPAENTTQISFNSIWRFEAKKIRKGD